jgi:hypothetical protein
MGNGGGTGTLHDVGLGFEEAVQKTGRHPVVYTGRRSIRISLCDRRAGNAAADEPVKGGSGLTDKGGSSFRMDESG